METANQLIPAESQDPSTPSLLNTWPDYLGRYLQHLAVTGYTAQSRYHSQRYLQDFIAWAQPRGIGSPQSVSEQVFERYLVYLHQYRKSNGAPLAPNGQRCKIVPLRGFFQWCPQEPAAAPGPYGRL